MKNTEDIKDRNIAMTKVSLQLLFESAGNDINKVFKRMLDTNIDAKTLGCWVWNMQTNALLMSPKIKKALGYTVEEFPDTVEFCISILTPKSQDETAAAMQLHIESNGDIPYEPVLEYIKKDGTIQKVICTGDILAWDSEGKPELMAGIHMPENGLYST